jgi:hypothetical protein
MFRARERTSMDDSDLSLTQCDYYCAIFEFAQGSFPLTIWENSQEIGQRITMDRDSFRLSVVNTPTNIQSSISDYRPIIIRSSFQGVHYIADFLQILDAQARGFTRPLVFVVANRIPEIIDWLASRKRSDLIDLGNRLQEHARSVFSQELREYALALRDVIHRTTSSEAVLTSKFEELLRVMSAFSVKLGDDNDNFERKPVEYFTLINNDLRRMPDMIELKFWEPEIRLFLESLPTSIFQVNVLARSATGLGNSPQRTISVLTATYDKLPDQFLLSKSPFFHHCVFALLAGHTLVIATDRRDDWGRSMAQRLSVVCPFDDPFPVLQGDKRTALECLKYPIVVCARPRIEGSGVSILNLDAGTFVGLTCPMDSVVRELNQFPGERENATVICASNTVKRIYGRFRIKIAEARARPLHTEDDMMKALKAWRFAPSDIPLFRYWVARASSSQTARPILLDWGVNKSAS